VIQRIRLVIVMARPPVLLLLALFTAIGLAQAGEADNRLLLAEALLVVVGYLLFSVVLNDLADEAIDRVNLPGDRRRPLVAGTAGRRDLAVVGVTAAVVALAASAALHWAAVVVVAAGLAVSAGYSLRPVRVADRGGAACLLLPAAYAAVPYLVGVLGARGALTARDLLLLCGLYVGFIGRIVLKDFRDVRGDALFGKRTFLVRHGRRRTCALSAASLVLGSSTLAAVQRPTPALALAWAVLLALALWLLRGLAVDRGPRREEALIAGIAIAGRGMLVTLLAHLSMTGAGWPAPAYLAVMGALLAITVAQARTMVRRGPATRLTVPAGWATAESQREPRPAGRYEEVRSRAAWTLLELSTGQAAAASRVMTTKPAQKGAVSPRRPATRPPSSAPSAAPP
jgi:4-hydroxybenzoate polyprenyltransferase